MSVAQKISPLVTVAIVLCLRSLAVASSHGWSASSRSDNLGQSGKTQRQKILQRFQLPIDPSRSTANAHPLDPLSPLEINTTSAIIRNYRNQDWKFNYVVLQEPEKSQLLPYFLRNANPTLRSIPRKAFVVLLDPATNQVHEVTVNLDTQRVETWNGDLTDVQPSITPEEMLESERILREDRNVIARCRRLGWADMSLVYADPWSMGYVGDREEFRGKRLIQLYPYGKNFEGDNQYAHPFDFLVVVDILEGKVIEIEDLPTHDDFNADNKVGNIVPRKTSNYDPALRDPNSFREDLRPVSISQPDGASFRLNGNELNWQKFKMRLGFNGREGLIIHHVSYNDGGKVRPLFYRMSLAEMFIPYGDPRPPYHRKHVFDGGQYGIGYNANELKPQIDCLGSVHFINVHVNNERGEGQQISRAVCIHEEDAGVLWKHSDFRTGEGTLVRSQRLVLSFTATVGNYDYIYSWYFYQDATIEFNVKLTGILSLSLLAVNATPAGYGSEVFPQVNAQYHQHFFSIRLDAEIDGNYNSVVVVDAVPLAAPTGSRENPYGQGFTTRRTLLKTTGLGRTNISPEDSRTWHIINRNSVHPYTKGPVGWKLMPWSTPPTLLKRDSPIHDQAEWLDYNTWVTPYKENQMFPGGFYLNNSGLPEWVGENVNANIDNTDVVIWHNIGLTHIPRVEDFPVMPVETCGLMLKPVNFFKENPALDVPPPRPSRDEL